MLNRLIRGIGQYQALVRNVKALAASNIPPATLQKSFTSVPDARQGQRNRFGRSISMDRIEVAVQSASRGNMQPITDLSRETIDTDPHFCAVLFKRFGAVTTLPWEIHPASGPGIDKERARYYAAVVRDAVFSLPSMRQRLLQLSWAVFDGRAAHEIIWRPTTSAGSTFGRVSMVPDRLDWIHPRRLCFGSRRELTVIDEGGSHPGNFSDVGFSLDPVELRKRRQHTKFIQWMPTMFGEYAEREGLAPRGMYWSFFKRYSQRERMILLELFGKPWRIIEVDKDADVNGEDMIAADEAADALGGSSSARMPKGASLNIVNPDAKSGENHRSIIEDSDRQISKLVLGQTGTTDPNPAGMNNTQADVMQDEQEVVLLWDAMMLSEIITTQLCQSIIEVNFGADELKYAPKFMLRWDRPTDRRADIERLGKALNAGVEVALSEAYETTGFRQPDDDETVIRIDQPPQPIGSANPPLPRPVVVHPRGTSPETGEQLPAAVVADVGEGARKDAAGMISTADLAKTVTVNEARAAQSLPPLTLPNGKLDPDGDLTLVEFEAKKMASASGMSGGFGSTFGGGGSPPPAPMAEDENDDDEDEGEEEEEDDLEEKDVEDEEGMAAARRAPRIENVITLHRYYDPITAVLGSETADRILAAAHAGEIELAYWYSLANPDDDEEDVSEHKQPGTDNGNPEDIIDNGMRELTRETGKWADHLGAAVVGLSTAPSIYNALNRAGEDLDPQKYGRALERRTIQTAALGALDDSAAMGMPGYTDFSKLPFQQAMKIFQEKSPVTKSVWNRLEAEAKRKSFTVAGLETQTMVQTAHGELARQIGQGADLREFRKWLTERFESSGLIQPTSGVGSASHVETVFRTNSLNAYGAGRYTNASQPVVLRARPVWGISGIDDGRTRKRHSQAHGKFLYASDPFWERAYAPFGFNCRCRINSHALTRDVALVIVPGSMLSFLPDKNFVSGHSNLLR